MFTGLVETTGEVIALSSGSAKSLRLCAPKLARETSLGESISVNGCCLTVTRRNGDELNFDLLEETLVRTNLGALHPGDPVNLERALLASGRLGGHFVQGHIDCASRVIGFEKIENDWRLEIELPRQYSRYVIEKGSIAINGVSLTVAELDEQSFVVWIIPHTFSETNFRRLKADDSVNLEFDLLAKYVERITTSKR